jgi:hypothetical protein
MNEDDVAVTHTEQVERGHRGLSRGGQHPRVQPRQAVRLAHDVAGRDDDVFCVRGEHGPAEHSMPHAHLRDTRTDRVDDSGELVAQPLRERRRHPRVGRAAAEQAVERLHPGGLDADPDLSGPRLRRRYVDDVQDVRSAVSAEHHSLAH